MRRRFHLIFNPGAGVIGSPLLEATVRALQRAGAAITRSTPVDFHGVRRDARAAAQSGGCDAIIAAGGDGTIRHVAAALLDQPIPLGIIPVGTANVLAQEIGLAATANAVAPMLLEGPIVKVATARANDEPFLLMAGAGFDARVVAALDQRLKSRLGRAAYAGPLLGAFIRDMDTLTLTIDGRRHEASWAVITNARHYGGRFVLTPRTGIHERGLEAILFKARSRADLLAQLMSLALGRLYAHAAKGGNVEMLPCSRVSISAHHPVPTQIDGDVAGTTPLEVEAGAEELQLIVPAPAGGMHNSAR
jgi:YegS/Rv2252/BmrU family lipid kinase